MKDIANTPLVSIICSTYNHGLYISQCLDGFLMQKTNFPFEILIHDDASTDNTPDIIREYEHNHPQVIRPIYQKENKYSKKEDIFAKYQCSRVRGKYIAICEGDDYWIDPLKLQKQIDFLENNPDYGMIYTTSKVYNQKEGKIEEEIIGREFNGYIELLSGNCIPTLTSCIRSALVMEYLKEVEPKSKNWLMGDYPMWLWISYYHKIKFLPSDVIIDKLDLSKWEREDKIIPLRNMYLIGIASNYGNEICLGATAGDRVLDKSPVFADIYEQLLNYLYQKQHWTEERKIKINLDFKRYTKTELIRIFVEQGGNIEEAFTSSFSCYSPEGGKECWSCKPCFRKFIAFALNGYPFTEEVIARNITYIKREVLPLIESGYYGRKQEEEEIKQVLSIYK